MYEERFDNREDLLEAVKKDGMKLRLAAAWLEIDKEVVLEAVKNNPQAMQFAPDELQKDEELLSYVVKDDAYYFDMVNPATGERYDIPMLNPSKPGYYFKYIDMMKEKEISPNTFEKILRWD